MPLETASPPSPTLSAAAESAATWKERAATFVRESRFREARDACTAMLRAWGEQRGPDFFDALIMTVGAHARLGEFGAALGYLDEAKRRAVTTADHFICEKFTGNCQLVTGHFEAALESFQQAWKLAVQLADVPKQAAILNNIGIIHRETGDNPAALEQFRQATQLNDIDTTGVMIARYNVGSTLLDMEEFDAAEAEFIWVLAEAEKHHDILHQALVLQGFGEIAEHRGQHAVALDCFKRAEPMLAASGDPRAKLQVDISRAEKMARHDALRDEAVRRIAQAVDDAEAAGGRTLVMALRAQVDILSRAGRVADALAASRRQAKLETEYNQRDSRGRLESLRVLHELETLKHAAEIARLKNEDLARALAEADLQRERAERGHAFTKGVLAMAAHDLRNPVGSVQGILEMLAHTTAPEERAELTRLAIEQTDVALELLNRLMDSVLAQRGELRLRLEPTDLVALAAMVIRGHTAAAARKGQHFDFDATSPPVFVRGDAVRLRQVLENLCSNAIKYSPTGAKLTVRVSHDGNTGAILRVTDEGPGIPAAERERIFEPFSRVSGITPTGGENSIGLGLHLARELTRAHQGTLAVESAPVRGSTFVLQLPAL